MLFVHGYHTSFPYALYRTAQLKPDFEIKAPMTLLAGRLRVFLSSICMIETV